MKIGKYIAVYLALISLLVSCNYNNENYFVSWFYFYEPSFFLNDIEIVDNKTIYLTYGLDEVYECKLSEQERKLIKKQIVQFRNMTADKKSISARHLNTYALVGEEEYSFVYHELDSMENRIFRTVQDLRNNNRFIRKDCDFKDFNFASLRFSSHSGGTIPSNYERRIMIQTNRSLRYIKRKHIIPNDTLPNDELLYEFILSYEIDSNATQTIGRGVLDIHKNKIVYSDKYGEVFSFKNIINYY